MNSLKGKKSQQGQSLISLLFFMVIGITVIAAATIILTTDILSASTQEQSTMSYYAAESGVEDALLRTLRNPTLTTTYTLTTADGTASVVITNAISGGTITDTIVSTGTSGSTTRKIQVVTGYISGQRTVTSWSEIQ